MQQPHPFCTAHRSPVSLTEAAEGTARKYMGQDVGTEMKVVFLRTHRNIME